MGREELSDNRLEPLVVVVDDDSRVRRSLETLLSSAGIEAQIFASGEEALLAADLAAASCLISDVRMPGIDGWELQRRTTAAHPGLPLIFVTAHRDDDAHKHALSMGAFAFFYKPFDGEELLLSVEAALTARSRMISTSTAIEKRKKLDDTD